MSASRAPRDERGFIMLPQFYPRFMRQVADLLDALVALEEPDPRKRENSHYLAGGLPLYSSEESGDPDELLGWVEQIDEKAWVFVPNPDLWASGRSYHV